MELSLNNMVSNLSGLDNGTDAKTVVMLTFHSNMNSSIVIGSGIVQGHRQYYIGNTVTTKEKFMTVVHEKIGFGKECSSWNIGQYAVQDIVSVFVGYELMSFLFYCFLGSDICYSSYAI